MKKTVLALLLSLFSLSANSQLKLDSLLAVWNDPHKADTTRLLAMYYICWDYYVFTKPDSAFYYAQKMYDFAKQRNQKMYMTHALSTQGTSYANRGDYTKAIEYQTKCLKIFEEIGHKQGIAALLSNIGMNYYNKSDYAKAIEYYNKSLKINEEIGHKTGTANCLSNIGKTYGFQGNYAKAMEYYTKSLRLNEETGNKLGIIGSLVDIGGIHMYQKDYSKALEYFNKATKLNEELGSIGINASNFGNIALVYSSLGKKSEALEYLIESLKLYEEIGDKLGVAATLNNIAGIYTDKGDHTTAMSYFLKSLKVREEIGNKLGITESLDNIGRIYFDLGNNAKALEYSQKALKLAEEIGAAAQIKEAAFSLWKVNKKLGRHKEALAMHELFMTTRDSLQNEENQKEVIRQEYKYNYDKQFLADSLNFAKEQDLKKIEHQNALDKEAQRRYILYGGLALLLLLGGISFRGYQRKKKDNILISIQKLEVEQQKHLVEEKHKEITDSINYAERIQRSFLATQDLLDQNLKDYFVYFQPKDVVSGDFYWASKLDNGNFAYVTADSTGHGVPGAIMSILNISSLERSIEKYSEPSEILNTTRSIIIDRLKKDGSEEGGKDGMDASLIVLNPAKTKLYYAAANNPIWILRNKDILELKPDKMPVGKHDKDSISFTPHEFDLQKGDIIYTFTDGLLDQFGGEKGKKFMYKKLKELLITFTSETMDEQKQKLKNAFENWKGELEQVDDVTIIGVRV